MGRFGRTVIDADGHGGEPADWRERIPNRYRDQMRTYQDRVKKHFADLPGGGNRPESGREMRIGMEQPGPRLADMDLEGIDVTVMFPPGSGEEWALLDPEFARVLCATLNDARAEYASFAPDRLKLVAKLPMIEPELAAAELERCAKTYPGIFVGMVCAQHVRERNLDDPRFDPVWQTAQRLNMAVCTHGGGQAPDQVPFGIDRMRTRLEIHAMTHPLGQMLAVTNFTIGGILHRFPKLRVGFMEAGVGWLPFWLERLDEHWEKMPEHAPLIDRKPSDYFLSGRCFLTCEPEERMLPYVTQAVGDGIICYASDYCHWDCAFPESVKLLEERSDLTEAQKSNLFAGNAARLYGLPLSS
jgi:predicted TIM-barrel fold metal-dependent hydrolase